MAFLGAAALSPRVLVRRISSAVELPFCLTEYSKRNVLNRDPIVPMPGYRSALSRPGCVPVPGNHLEVLKGTRAGRHSIRINDQWRICFDSMAKKTKPLQPIHPGEILSEEFMKPLGLSINRLSRDLGVPPNRIHGLVHGTRSITADTALRLGTYSGVAPETWLNLICASPGEPRGRRLPGPCASAPPPSPRIPRSAGRPDTTPPDPL